MGRARRAKNTKSNFKIWIPIICIIMVAITFFMIHDMQNKIEDGEVENTTNDEIFENEMIEENIISEEQNQMTEEIEQNTLEDTENTAVAEPKNTTSDTSSEMPSSNQPMTPAVTDKKQKAIELVKKEWGEDDTVNYMFDYINENGEYVIAVKDRASATVKNYFRVNLETETVELD